MRVSVIIPTYRRAQYLRDAVASVMAQDFPRDEYEILVVDNAPQPTPELASLCDSLQSPPVRYVHEPRNGLHHARHAGAKRARGDILVYVDDDIRATSGWLAALCRPFATAPVGVVGGRICPEWDVEPPEWIRTFSPGYLSLLDLGDSRLELTWPQQVYGCNLAVRKSVLFDVGGFHPDSFADPGMRWYRGDGETGLLRKVYAAGHGVWYEPAACVRHRISAARLTPAYFERRAFNQGISDSFTAYRARYYPLHEYEMPRRGRFALGNGRLPRMARLAAGCLRGNAAAWIGVRVRFAYLRGRIGHTVRLMLSLRLRRYLRRENFISDQDAFTSPARRSQTACEEGCCGL